MTTPEHAVSLPAALSVAAFCVVYLAFLARQIYRGSIDLYDFLMLSMIAVVPSVFVFVPGVANWVSSTLGIAFPFVFMFSALLLIVFVVIHHMIVKLHALEKKVRELTQDVGLASITDSPDNPKVK